MKKGFTLVELLVVIIIVGILASVGISQYTKVIEKGRAAEARMILGNLRAAEIAEFNENGAYVIAASLSVGAPANCAQTTHYFSYTCAAATGMCTAARCGTGTGKPPGSATAYNKTLTIAGVWGGTAGY
ncbi:MAG: type IV pilin protein [Candidatus Omnitrophota bacterium]